jgi:hypothetical protein
MRLRIDLLWELDMVSELRLVITRLGVRMNAETLVKRRHSL